MARVPLMPGINDSEENMHKLGEFVSGTGGLKVELLPFHHFGRGEYRSLQEDYKP